MRILSVLLFSGAVISMMSCSSVTIKTDYDHEFDFSKFKTYRWASAKEVNPQDELQKRPLVLKRVIQAVNQTLTEKGLTDAGENSTPDLVVMVHAGVKDKMQVNSTGGGYYSYRGWYDPWWGPYGGTTTVSYYEEATLIIDLVDWEKMVVEGDLGSIVLFENGDESECVFDAADVPERAIAPQG